MGGLARLLDEMTTDPFWKTAPAPSLFKRLDTPAAAALGSVKVDVKETATAYEISADLPGVKKEDIKLSFSDAGALTIEAERREHWEEALPPAAVESAGAGVDGAVEGAEQQQQQLLKYHFKETTYGKVARSFKLPQNADSANVEATLSDGVLRVTIPKREAPAARTFEIK